MKKFTCPHCSKQLSSKSSLNNHIWKAQYCIKQRENKEGIRTFKCLDCEKNFTSKQTLNYHSLICVERLKNNNNKIIEKYEEKINNLTISKNKIISELKNQISVLQDKLENVALKAVSRPTHTSNKTIQINNYIKNMEPLNIGHIRENIPMLTLDHHVRGPEGYAEYALEFPFKNRIVCVDVSRNKIKYKNEEGDIVEDLGFRKMMVKLCDALKDRSYKLCQDHYEKLLDKFSEEEMDNTDFDFMEAAKAIHKYANGRESEFCSKIIRLISRGATQNKNKNKNKNIKNISSLISPSINKDIEFVIENDK